MSLKRRKFIKQAGTICIGCLGMGSLLTACASSNLISSREMDDKIIIRKSDMQDKKYVTVRPASLPAPVLLSLQKDGSYAAVLMYCTHKGCELNVAGNYLVCPCHGSEFTQTGAVLNPPAEKNLLSFHTESDSENIYIYLKRNQ